MAKRYIFFRECRKCGKFFHPKARAGKLCEECKKEILEQSRLKQIKTNNIRRR